MSDQPQPGQSTEVTVLNKDGTQSVATLIIVGVQGAPAA